MPTTLHLRTGLEPVSLKDYRRFNEPIKSIISDFIKVSERTFPDDRKHVKNMLPFEGSTDVAHRGGDFGFFSAIYCCYNNHWGLTTVPDDWWYTIIRTVALAIDKNSKKKRVRKYFVNHRGKKELTVDVDPCGIDFEKFFREMTDLIQSNVNVSGYVDAIRSDFSTSTSTHRIVSEITVMSSMQEFFSYCMRTMCGIPLVELQGDHADWMKLKTKLMSLKEMLTPINEKIGLLHWWGKVELICDKLIETAEGKGDREWWSYIFSQNRHGYGSGAYTTYDGWFLNDLLNISDAESLRSLPSGLVSVPLKFDLRSVISEGAIVAGIAGIKIDDSKKIPMVSSAHGWAIFR